MFALTIRLAFYEPGTSSKPGCFRANLDLHKTSPCIALMAILLHEANPGKFSSFYQQGHHHQVSLAFESPKHPIRRVVQVTSFIEGWGLYAEYLGEEMGMYTDRLQYYGRLELEMFRALRLVVDTGLHAKGWGIEQAVDYMAQYCSLQSRDELFVEVKRYSILPGQAVTYKVGQLKILEIRSFAEKTLGSKFDLKEFHEALLALGNMTLGGLEKCMRKWVEQQK